MNTVALLVIFLLAVAAMILYGHIEGRRRRVTVYLFRYDPFVQVKSPSLHAWPRAIDIAAHRAHLHIQLVARAAASIDARGRLTSIDIITDA